MTQPAKVTIDIWSDVMCPWCIIGYAQLQKGLATLQGELKCGTNCGSCVPELKRLSHVGMSRT